MLNKKMHEAIRNYIESLQRHAGRPWYPLVLGLLTAIDSFVVVIPSDGILISSAMLTPRRWLALALTTAVGATLGSVALAYVVQWEGWPWILYMFPGIDQSWVWIWTEEWLKHYGLLFIFLFAITPLMQQPVIILASLAGIPLGPFTVAMFLGRLAKYLILAYIGSHTPRLIGRIWGLKRELADAGLKSEKT